MMKHIQYVTMIYLAMYLAIYLVMYAAMCVCSDVHPECCVYAWWILVDGTVV